MGDGGMPLSQVNRNRIKNILILLLMIALTVLLVISLPLMKSRDNNRTNYIQQIQKECKEAYNETNALSRTAGADSAAILSRVRSNIHAVRAINSLSGSDGGKALLEDERVLTLQNMVDQYLQYLTTGMDTGGYTTNLQTALIELQDIVNTLE
jgi:mannitol-specific phosphotransferase system IIBC component